MNYRIANRGFLGMVLLHLAVVAALLIGNVTSMSILLNLFLSEMMLAVPALLALLFSGERPNRVLCFHRMKFTSVLMVIVFTFLMGPLTTFLNAVSMLFVDNAVVDMSGQMLEYPFPVMLFMMAVFGPACEELAFRGILYRGYLKSGSALRAVLLSALLFGLIHMNFNQAPYAFALGAAMALLMETTGSPSFFSSVAASMASPAFSTASIMLRAMMTGTSISISCVVRYRFRSRLVASTTLMTQSGFSSRIKLREMISSGVYGDSE